MAVLNALDRAVHAVVLVRVVHHADGGVDRGVFADRQLVLQEGGRLVYVIHKDRQYCEVRQRRLAFLPHADDHVVDAQLLVVQRGLAEQLARVGVDAEDAGVVDEELVLLSHVPVADRDVQRDWREGQDVLGDVNDRRVEVENGGIVVVDDVNDDGAQCRQGGRAVVLHGDHEEVLGLCPEVERRRHGDGAVRRDREVADALREGEGQVLLS